MNRDIAELFDCGIEAFDALLPSPELYQYYMGIKNRTLIINKDIAEDAIERFIVPLLAMDNDGTGEPIEIIVNTPGGEVYSGFAIVDAIEKLKTKTTIRIVGMAASMGIYIAMAHAMNPNVETVCSKYAVGLIHSGAVKMGIQNTKDAEDYMDFSKEYERELIKPYVLSHTKLTEAEYDTFERKQLWLTAQKMLEYGMVSRIE